MYQDRFILFIDILGFRNIISKTQTDSSIAESLYKVLNSLRSEEIGLESFGSINTEVIEADGRNITEVQKFLAMANSMFRSQYSLSITHFSDSLVISCDANHEDTCFIIFDLIARLNYRLWNEHQLLMRGGVTVGKLVHEENGPLFGPAMVRAYDIESKLSKFPRVLIDNTIAHLMLHSDNYKRMKPLFGNAEDGYLEISLATSLAFLLQSLHGIHPLMQKKYLEVFKNLSHNLNTISDSIKSEDEKSKEIKAKYDWLSEKSAHSLAQTVSKINEV